MLSETSVCFMMISEGIKRFIEKPEEYRCIQPVNVTLTTVNI
jgi:hypothetical protein